MECLGHATKKNHTRTAFLGEFRFSDASAAAISWDLQVQVISTSSSTSSAAEALRSGAVWGTDRFFPRNEELLDYSGMIEIATVSESTRFSCAMTAGTALQSENRSLHAGHCKLWRFGRSTASPLRISTCVRHVLWKCAMMWFAQERCTIYSSKTLANDRGITKKKHCSNL